MRENATRWLFTLYEKKSFFIWLNIVEEARHFGALVRLNPIQCCVVAERVMDWCVSYRRSGDEPNEREKSDFT